MLILTKLKSIITGYLDKPLAYLPVNEYTQPLVYQSPAIWMMEDLVESCPIHTAHDRKVYVLTRREWLRGFLRLPALVIRRARQDGT